MANSAGEKKTITIDLDKFVHTRNALNTAFLGLSNSIDKAVKAYIEHTQAVLEDDGTLDLSILLQPFETLQAASAVKQVIAQNDVLAAEAAAITLDPTVAFEKKKKRAYKPRDPNAPKRPLTAYLRYFQTVRPQIKQEIANGERPQTDVSAACSEMWHALTQDERDAFKKDYRKEVVGYEKACAAYKAAGGTDEGLGRALYTDEDLADENLDNEDASGDESDPLAEPIEEEPAPKKAAAKAKPAPAPAPAVKASATPAKPKAAPKKKAAAAAAAAAAAPAAAAPTPKTEGKQKFSSLNPPRTFIDEPVKTEVEKTPTARKRKATVKAAADEATEAETPKPKRARKSKAMKEAEEAELAKTLEAAASSTPAAPAAAAAAPASESKAKKPRKRKSEVAAE